MREGKIPMSYCSKCGAVNPDYASHCSSCGAPLSGAAPAPGFNSTPGFNAAPGYGPVSGAEPGKGLAIASMVCGIVSFFIFGLILGVVALVLGLVAKNKGYRGGMATAGVAMGAVALGLYLIAMIACSASFAALPF